MNSPDKKLPSFHPLLATETTQVPMLLQKDHHFIPQRVSDACLKRFDQLFDKPLQIKNRERVHLFDSTLRELLTILGFKGAYFYGSFVKYLLDCDRSYSSQYFFNVLNPLRERPGDIDIALVDPSYTLQERHNILRNFLLIVLKKIKDRDPDYTKDPNQDRVLTNLLNTLFKAFWNKEGEGRYAHHKFLMFSLNVSSVRKGLQASEEDVEDFSIDFIVTQVALPQLFDIEILQLPIAGYMQGNKEIVPEPPSCIKAVVKWVNQRADINPAVVIDEASCMKLIKMRRKGIYISFKSDIFFRDVLKNPKLHRTQPPKPLNVILERVTNQMQRSVLTLTLFLTQFRIMFLEPFPHTPLNSFQDPKNWQEKLINWLQKQLDKTDFDSILAELGSWLILKMLTERHPHIKYFEDQLRIEFPIQQVSFFLFLPLFPPAFKGDNREDLREVLEIREDSEIEPYIIERGESELACSLEKDNESQFLSIFQLLRGHLSSFTVNGSSLVYRAYLKGWIDLKSALIYSHPDLDYDMSDRSNPFTFEILKKYPTMDRARKYFSLVPFNRESVSQYLQVRNFLTIADRSLVDEMFLLKGIQVLGESKSLFLEAFEILKESFSYNLKEARIAKPVFEAYLKGWVQKTEVLLTYCNELDYISSLALNDPDSLGFDILLLQPSVETARLYLKNRDFSKEYLKKATGLENVEELYFLMNLDRWCLNQDTVLKYLYSYIKEGLFTGEIEIRLKRNPGLFTQALERLVLVDHLESKLAYVYVEIFPQALHALKIFLNPQDVLKDENACLVFLNQNKFKLTKKVISAIARVATFRTDVFEKMSKSKLIDSEVRVVYQSDSRLNVVKSSYLPGKDDEDLFCVYFSSVAEWLIPRVVHPPEYDLLFNILNTIAARLTKERISEFTDIIEKWLLNPPRKDPEAFLKHYEFAAKILFQSSLHLESLQEAKKLIWMLGIASGSSQALKSPPPADFYFAFISKFFQNDDENEIIRGLYLLNLSVSSLRKGRAEDILKGFNAWEKRLKQSSTVPLIEAIIPFFFNRSGVIFEGDKKSLLNLVKRTFEILKELYYSLEDANIKSSILTTLVIIMVKLTEKNLIVPQDSNEMELSYMLVPYLKDFRSKHYDLVPSTFWSSVEQLYKKGHPLYPEIVNIVAPPSLCQLV